MAVLWPVYVLRGSTKPGQLVLDPQFAEGLRGVSVLAIDGRVMARLYHTLCHRITGWTAPVQFDAKCPYYLAHYNTMPCKCPYASVLNCFGLCSVAAYRGDSMLYHDGFGSSLGFGILPG